MVFERVEELKICFCFLFFELRVVKRCKPFFYFCGGSWLGQVNQTVWKLAIEVSQHLGCEIYVVVSCWFGRFEIRKFEGGLRYTMIWRHFEINYVFIILSQGYGCHSYPKYLRILARDLWISWISTATCQQWALVIWPIWSSAVTLELEC